MGHEDSFFWLNADFSGVIGIERALTGCGGNRLIVFSELALLLFDNVFRVMTGANLIFALPFFRPGFSSPTLKLAICFSIMACRRPLSILSISSNWEKMSAITTIKSFWLKFTKFNHFNQMEMKRNEMKFSFRYSDNWTNLVFVRFQCSQYHWVCSIRCFCRNDYLLLWWSPRDSQKQKKKFS